MTFNSLHLELDDAVRLEQRLAPRGQMSTSRVYEPIYTVKNVYNL